MILAIETAGYACSVALLDGPRLIAEAHEVLRRGHAERLIPMLSSLPDGGRADAIVVGCGPGSFTGVRVGIAAARALGLAWHVPVTGCNSLALVAAEAMAMESSTPGITIVMEGGHGEVFVQGFGVDKAPLVSLSYADAEVHLAGLTIAGNAAHRFKHDDVRATDARAASVRFLEAADCQLPPSPTYGRSPDAKPMATP